jgi:hypothetical protein
MPKKHPSRQVRKAQRAGYRVAMKAYLTAIAAGTPPPSPPVKAWLKPNPIQGTR